MITSGLYGLYKKVKAKHNHQKPPTEKSVGGLFFLSNNGSLPALVVVALPAEHLQIFVYSTAAATPGDDLWISQREASKTKNQPAPRETG